MGIGEDPNKVHSREKLERFVADYNGLYQTQHSVKDSQAFYTYYKDIAKRMKERDRTDFQDKDRADILLVVNMFLTGFDAKKVNTLYVDKNLKFHGLIQAYSRTNRTFNELKSQGNIVCFRNLKNNTDAAIALFSDPDAEEIILMRPLEEYIEQMNAEVQALRSIAQTPQAVDYLLSEDEQLLFVQAFRDVMRTLNVLKSFTEFKWADVALLPQTFEDYKSKYLDIYDRTRNGPEEGASIIDEVDFELELIQRDEINVAYILRLLAELHEARADEERSPDEIAGKQQAIIKLLGQETQLRSKRELIEKFINEYMPNLEAEAAVEDEFAHYWSAEKEAALVALCEAEGLNREKVEKLIGRYHFTGKEPLRNGVLEALNFKPKVLERGKIFERVVEKLMEMIHTFDDDMGGI